MNNSINKAQIQFWKLATFNEKLNATIAFIKKYKKQLFKAILYLSGPFYLIAIGLILYNTEFLIQYIRLNGLSDNTNLSTIIFGFIKVFFGFLFYGFAYLAIMLVVFQVIETEQNAPDKINDIDYIGKRVRARILKMLGVLILFVFIAAMITAVINGILMIFLAIPLLGAIINVILYVIFTFSIYSYSMVLFPAAYYEDDSIGDAIARAFTLNKGHFWETLGIYAGASAIQYVIVNGIIVPVILFIFYSVIRSEYFEKNSFVYSDKGQEMLTYLILLVLFVYLTLSLLSSIFFIISSAIQYFSLKEANDNDHIYITIENFDQLGVD